MTPLVPSAFMMTPILTAALLAFASAPLTAQQLNDSGLPNLNSNGATTVSGVIDSVHCGNGLTPAHAFTGSNKFAGNMVDIAPTADMTIKCVDVNWDVVESIDVALWWCPGTVVGNDVNQLGTWQQFSLTTVTANGSNVPTNVHLYSSPVFLAGQTYGLYIQVVNYATTAGDLRYSVGGPNVYAGTHCSLTTYYGKGDGLTSHTFSRREWNGNLYTELVGSGGPTLTLSDNCPIAAVTLSISNCTPNSGVALLFGDAGSFTKPSNTCGGLVLGIQNPILGSILTTDGSGAASYYYPLRPNVCGKTIQGVDIASCTATNTVVL